jgi:hypothetical protein
MQHTLKCASERNWWLCKIPLWQQYNDDASPPGRHVHGFFKQHRTTNHSITGHITNAVQILKEWWLGNFMTYMTIHTLFQIQDTIKTKHFSHQEMHNITKLHSTQHTPYTVSPKLIGVKSCGWVDIRKQYFFVVLYILLLFKQFQHLDFYGLSRRYTDFVL